MTSRFNLSIQPDNGKPWIHANLVVAGYVPMNVDDAVWAIDISLRIHRKSFLPGQRLLLFELYPYISSHENCLALADALKKLGWESA